MHDVTSTILSLICRVHVSLERFLHYFCS